MRHNFFRIFLLFSHVKIHHLKVDYLSKLTVGPYDKNGLSVTISGHVILFNWRVSLRGSVNLPRFNNLGLFNSQ